ncbi:hypothetical protein CEXT_156131 [Caerostris extrusa]|uniref:Uncharacterized protein n=1 Tax=Caerostris extrusa TaxID=172846 RepID=A0AAV4NJ71_CAEEX|nr:hypothetical protein CEXT_156131 [Caerostris extrusa]
MTKLIVLRVVRSAEKEQKACTTKSVFVHPLSFPSLAQHFAWLMKFSPSLCPDLKFHNNVPPHNKIPRRMKRKRNFAKSGLPASHFACKRGLIPPAPPFLPRPSTLRHLGVHEVFLRHHDNCTHEVFTKRVWDGRMGKGWGGGRLAQKSASPKR